MWALQTGLQIDWAHLVRYRMHKELRANAPLPYPHLVTLFLHYFNVPLDDEPFVKVKCSFAIGACVIPSFGYRKDVDGQWVWKQDLPPLIPNERTPSPPPQRDSSSSLRHDVLIELRDLWAFVGDLFDAMDSCIMRLEDDMSFIR